MDKSDYPTCVRRRKFRYRGTNRISPRQAEYIQKIFQGHSLAEVANLQCVTVKAVKHMVTELNFKFGTRRRSEWLTRFAARTHHPEIQEQLEAIVGQMLGSVRR